MTRAILLATAMASTSLVVSGCEEPDNSLDGSLGSQYDLAFDLTRARQFDRSNELLIEYIRDGSGSEEKPIMVTVRPVPEGPGIFDYDDDAVRVDNSLAPGQPDLPALTSATVELTSFTPDEPETTVEGTIHAMFTNAGRGDAFALEGRFKANLEVMP